MTKLGEVRIVYFGEENNKKSATGVGEDKGQYIKVELNPSKRRIKFDTILIPWNRVIKVTVF
jgi:sporulation protein YlmC with PRC-barrel domain